MSNHKTPSIRFKGFTDDWEQRKLEDFGKATGGTSIESEFSEDGIYKVISIGSYSENSVYNDQGIRAIKSDKTSNRVLNRNDLTMILNDKTTSGNIIGRVLLIEESGIYIYNQRTERIEINLDEYDPVFLYEMLNAPNIREKIIKQAQGNTQIYVNWTAISLLEYMIPSKEEQVKIGEYLHSISNLITLHQRKYEKLVNVKKSMLDKMFPKNGEKVPEIRFKGFTDDWEQRKLGNVIEIAYQGINTTADKVEYVSEGVPILQGKHITSGKIDYKDVRYLDKEKYESVYYPKYVPKVNDILLANIGTIGPLVVMKPGVELLIAWNIMLIRLNKMGDVKFVKVFLDKLNNSNFYESIMRGNATKFINKDGIMSIEIPYPTICEQEKIGAWFEQLDNLITLHQRELEKLQNLKKSLLNSMFI
mgnify:CR=1 FL=1